MTAEWSGDSPARPLARTSAELIELLADLNPQTDAVIELVAGREYVLDSSLTLNIARIGLCGSSSALVFTSGGLRLTCEFSGAVGWEKFSSQTKPISGVRIEGPGRTVAGSIGVQLSTSTGALGCRPLMSDCMVHGFETLVDLDEYAYLAHLRDVDLYDGQTAIRQSVGADAGENCRITGGVIHSCDLAFDLIDPTSEWFCYGLSVDYCNQLVVVRGSPSRLHMFGCHIEPRGANNGADYVILGTGADARAVVPGRDSFIDIDGNGSYFLMSGGWFDINNSGGVGPYAFDHLVNLRHKNAYALFDGTSMQNMANTANRFWTGAGHCVIRRAQVQDAPGMPTRISDQARGNALQDGGFEDAAVQDLWSITKDTATITSRTTGANLSFARSTAQFYAGASSMLATKVGAGGTGAQISVFVPVQHGERVSFTGRVYRPSSGGITGSIFTDLRYVNMKGFDANGIPQVASLASTSASSTLPTTTNAWTAFTQKTFDNGSSGEVAAPAWATHARLTFNLDGGSAGVVYFDDMSVSRW